MNTARYNKDDLQSTQELFSRAENCVYPSEYYTGAENSANAAKLHALLSKARTVIAEEDGVLFGLASMDNQGNIGMLYVEGDNVKKTAKLLIRALEKQAAKKQIPNIFVVARGDARKIFKECDYLPPENAGKSADGDEQTPLSKRIAESVAPVEFLPDKARRITLDSRKPIVAEGTVFIVPLLFFSLSCFFAVILIFIVLMAQTGGKVAGYENMPLFIIIVSVMLGAALVVLIADKIRLKLLKRKILEGWITNGVITEFFSESHWTHRGSGYSDRGSRYVTVYLTYVFYDEKMNLCTAKFSHKYQGRAPDFYKGEKVIVAYSDGVSYLLKRFAVIKEEEIIAIETEK